MGRKRSAPKIPTVKRSIKFPRQKVPNDLLTSHGNTEAPPIQNPKNLNSDSRSSHGNDRSSLGKAARRSLYIKWVSSAFYGELPPWLNPLKFAMGAKSFRHGKNNKKLF